MDDKKDNSWVDMVKGKPKSGRATKGDLRKAILEHCKDCIYDTCDVGTFKDQISKCDISRCALWPYRYQRPAAKQPNIQV